MAEALNDPFSPRTTHLRPKLGVTQEAADSLSETPGFRRRNREPRFAIEHDLRCAVNRRGHHRLSGCQRLDSNNWETFIKRRQDCEFRQRQPILGIRLETHEAHRFFESESPGLGLELAAELAFPRTDQTHTREPGADSGQGFEEEPMSFLRLKARQNHNHGIVLSKTEAASEADRGNMARVKALKIAAIVDDCYFLLRQTLLCDQVPGDRLGDGNVAIDEQVRRAVNGVTSLEPAFAPCFPDVRSFDYQGNATPAADRGSYQAGAELVGVEDQDPSLAQDSRKLPRSSALPWRLEKQWKDFDVRRNVAAEGSRKLRRTCK